jgi:hypothetical protein
MKFFNKLCATLLAAFMVASAIAKSSYNPSYVESPQIKPCMVQVTSTHWANANALVSIETSAQVYGTSRFPKKGVIWIFGNIRIDLPTEAPEFEIQRFLEKVERQCK